MGAVLETTWAGLSEVARPSDSEATEPIAVSIPLYEEMSRAHASAKMRELLAPAIADVEAGRTVSWEEVEAELRGMYFLLR